MRRGEVWTVSGAGGFLGKPRPAVILQSEAFDQTRSIVVCPFTTDGTEAPIFRLTIDPNDENGLRERSVIMTDKIGAVDRSKLGARLGRLTFDEITRLERALLIFLGMAQSHQVPVSS